MLTLLKSLPPLLYLTCVGLLFSACGDDAEEIPEETTTEEATQQVQSVGQPMVQQPSGPSSAITTPIVPVGQDWEEVVSASGDDELSEAFAEVLAEEKPEDTTGTPPAEEDHPPVDEPTPDPEDNVAPAIPVFITPETSTVLQGNPDLAVALTCEAGATVSYSTGETQTDTACIDGQLNFTFTASAPGETLLTVWQTDAAGNLSGSDTIVFAYDPAVPPAPQITGASDLYVRDAITLEGTCEPGRQVKLSGAKAAEASPAELLCEDGSFSFAVERVGKSKYFPDIPTFPAA